MDITLPFGLRSACLNAQRVSNAVRHLYRVLYQRDLINFIDDFGSAASPEEADLAYHQLRSLIQDILGLDIGPDKCVLPTFCLIFLGIEISTEDFVMRIPQHKIDAALLQLRKWLARHQASKRQLQSLLGTLIHISTCVKPGPRFVSRFIDLIRKDQFPVVLDYNFKLDINWWLRFIQQYNGVNLIQDTPWSPPDAIISINATTTACAGFYQRRYFHTLLPDHIRRLSRDIWVLELITLAVALKLWGACLPRQRMVISRPVIVSRLPPL